MTKVLVSNIAENERKSIADTHIDTALKVSRIGSNTDMAILRTLVIRLLVQRLPRTVLNRTS